MKVPFFLLLFSMLSLNPDAALEKRVAELEKQVDVLTNLTLSNDIRSRLSFGVNRNFIYNGSYFSSWNDKATKLVHYFTGYLSKEEFDKKQRDHRIFMAREYIHSIADIILGKEGERYDKAVLEVEFFDTVYNIDPIITADTGTKSIKILLDGKMTEVGWEK